MAAAVALVASGALCVIPAHAQVAHPGTSVLMVAPPTPDADALAAQMRILAADPKNADALIKVDFLSIEYGAMGESADTNGISYGGRVEAGYRFDVTPSTFVEPRASLAYVATDIDDFDILGNTVSIDGGDSLQGTIGFRAGTALDGGDGMTIVPYLTADVGNEFLGDASASFDAGGAVAEVDDQAGIDGVFGQVGVGIDLVDLGDGISAFAKGNYRFAEDYNSLSGNVGVRIAW